MPKLFSTLSRIEARGLTPLSAILIALLLVSGLSACTTTPPQADPDTSAADADKLAAILESQPAEVQARYQYRHPMETLTFFGIEPGMTVVEALPGGGWYSKLLLPYLGPQGQLIGANYPTAIWPNFGFANEEFLERMKTWTTDWPAQAEEWRNDSSAPVSAFVFGELPQASRGSADAVLLVRALHNLARFDHAFLDLAIANSFDVLKPGGVLGVVQHEARPDMPDDWANGSNGYLKKSFVIGKMQAAGFKFVADSAVNENDLDQPGTADFVWRLPPSLRTAKDNPELAAELTRVGESNRMTLMFIKPAG